jgi:hypothetical protein
MAEVKDEKAEAKTQVEKLKSDYGAEDMGTYMDARVDGKAIRVAVWNQGLQSYQPTEEGVALLTTPSPKEKAAKDKAAAKPGATAQPTQPGAPHQQPTPPPPPPGTRPAG